MKHLLVTLITLYQRFVSPLLWQALGIRAVCRYNESCSAYAIRVIHKHGVLKGLMLALNRLLHCQPFTKSYVSNH